VAFEDPGFVKSAASEFGSSTIVVAIDVKKKIFGKQQVCILSGTRATGTDPVSYARIIEENGAGEIIINSINNDGMMNGYDLEMIRSVSESVSIPVVATGGAGELSHFRKAVIESYASAVAAGSLFVYHGPRRAVLINYPSQEELLNLFNQ
jgi:cyclase